MFILVYGNQARVAKTITMAGISFSMSKIVEGEEVTAVQVDVPVAHTGQLTTRTDANTGTLTMAAGHDLTTGCRFDLYWTEAGVAGVQRAITAGTVSVNSVPFDLGVGDNLPTNMNAVIACKCVQQPLSIVGSSSKVIVSICAEKSVFVFADGSDVEKLYRLNTGTDAQEWDSTLDAANPLSALTVTKVWLSHIDTTDAQTMKIGVLSD